MRAAEQETEVWKVSWEASGVWLCGPPIPILHYLNLILKGGNGRIIFLKNYQSRVDLQRCANFCCIAK